MPLIAADMPCDAAHTPHGDDNPLYHFALYIVLSADAAHTPHGDDNTLTASGSGSTMWDAAHTPHGDDNIMYACVDGAEECDAAHTPHGDDNSNISEMKFLKFFIDAAHTPHGDDNASCGINSKTSP